MQNDYLDFEHELQAIDLAISDCTDQPKLAQLSKQRAAILAQLYKKLDAWQIVQMARHPDRPHAKDFIDTITTNQVFLSGDRITGRCPATIACIAKIKNQPVVIVGQNKGRSIQERMQHQYGMPNPCGYRLALRAFKLAERYNYPILTLIDTPGAFPGIDGEIQNQSAAISENLLFLSQVKVPVINIVIGEGMSGGALGIGVGDRLAMLQNSILSVISPEGCASILWKDAKMAKMATQSMKITADELLKLGLIDAIIDEGPNQCAHNDFLATKKNVTEYILTHVRELGKLDKDALIKQRQQKLMRHGI